jgi:hypothetical protein
MRRILAVVISATLLMAFAAGSTSAKTTRLVDAHALLALDGTPIGWIDAHLTTPTDADPTPGVIDFTPLPGVNFFSWQAISENAAFYRNDGDGAPSAVVYAMQCRFYAAGDYQCVERTFWFIDEGAGAKDFFVSAPQSDETDQTTWTVVSGDIQVQVP